MFLDASSIRVAASSFTAAELARATSFAAFLSAPFACEASSSSSCFASFSLASLRVFSARSLAAAAAALSSASRCSFVLAGPLDTERALGLSSWPILNCALYFSMISAFFAPILSISPLPSSFTNSFAEIIKLGFASNHCSAVKGTAVIISSLYFLSIAVFAAAAISILDSVFN